MQQLLELLPKLAGGRVYSAAIKHLRGVDDKGPLICKVPAVLMAFCGLRVEEVSGLQLRDIDPEQRRLTVQRAIAKNRDGRPYVKGTKTRQTRVVPLAALVCDALTLEKRRHDENALVSGGTGTRTAGSYQTTTEVRAYPDRRLILARVRNALRLRSSPPP
jgi:integrase